MGALEILALIFALLVLVKIIVIMIKPMSWMGVTETFLKENAFITVVYLVLAIIVGYYVFASLSLVEVAAVMLFTSLLIVLAVLPYSKTVLKFMKEIMKSKDCCCCKNWLAIVIWLLIALLVLYKLFI